MSVSKQYSECKRVHSEMWVFPPSAVVNIFNYINFVLFISDRMMDIVCGDANDILIYIHQKLLFPFYI